MSQDEDDAESGLVAELRALAGAGRGGDEGSFKVRWRGHTISVIHNSGSSSSLLLRVAYDDVSRADHHALVSSPENDGSYRQPPSRVLLSAARPLAIALDHETLADTRAVVLGSRREHQTGDHAFDTAVFIGGPTTDDAVLRAVLGPEVRAAVLSLFTLGFLRVKIDDAIIEGTPGLVEAYLWAFAMRDPPAKRGERCLDAFARLLDHLPTITPSGERHASPSAGGWIRVLGWVGGIGLLAGGPAFWVAMDAQCTEGSSFHPACESRPAIALLVAIVGGAIASFIVRPSLIRKFGERSGSFVPIAVARLKVFAGCAVLTFLLLVVLLFVLRV